MNVLIAPNAFKHSISAIEAADAIEDGLKKSKHPFDCEKFPVGDGGDGTGDLIIKKLKGTYYSCISEDPLGRKITAPFGIVNGDTAVIEMANASGIRLLSSKELHPLKTSSYGTGLQIVEALHRGASKIILTMGGSATVDGGWGILRALGVKFFNASGSELNTLSSDLAWIDRSAMETEIKNVSFTILCDVNNPLLGPSGAAAVFGPQKGASVENIIALENALQQFAEVCAQQLRVDINQPRCGTAGGAAAGLYAITHATLTEGIKYFMQLTGFEDSLNKADIVITGEGIIDTQTLQGKAPFGVAKLAKQKGKLVVGLAGQVEHPLEKELVQYFDILESINVSKTNLETALKNTYKNLMNSSERVAEKLSAAKFT